MILNQYQDKLNIKKVVLPAAGLGTRLLPITKETPKETKPKAKKTAEKKETKPKAKVKKTAEKKEDKK